jgi:hypothetical protein
MDNIRMYAEVNNAPGVAAGDRVFQVRQAKPNVDTNVTKANRLNASAWSGLRAQLGL